MPELPEVETCRRGLKPHLTQQMITGVIIRERRLRQPIADNLAHILKQQTINDITRRGKYLILHLDRGYLLIHLGMSGTVRIIPASTIPAKHDHLDICLSSQQCLRYHDPRRFGLVVWNDCPLERHPLLQHLGVEPLTPPIHSELFNKSGAISPLPNQNAHYG